MADRIPSLTKTCRHGKVKGIWKRVCGRRAKGALCAPDLGVKPPEGAGCWRGVPSTNLDPHIGRGRFPATVEFPEGAAGFPWHPTIPVFQLVPHILLP